MSAWAVVANERLAQMRVPDAVIAVHSSDGAYLRSSAPIVLIHDATWPQLLDFYPFYDRHRLAKVTLDGGSKLDRLALANCKLALYSSQWAADGVVREYNVDRQKLLIHPFGANMGSIPAPDDLEKSINRRGQQPCRLLFVGVQWDRKGGELALGVAQHLHDRGMEVELQIVGCDVPATPPSFVRCFGFLSKAISSQAAQLSRLFLEADFLILPTRADCSPIVLSEAAAHGLPVVTTDVGGIKELFSGEAWGIALQRDSSAIEYADWIETTYQDRTRYRCVARAARRQFDKSLNWDRCTEFLVTAIRALKMRTISG